MSVFSGPDITIVQQTLVIAVLACTVATDIQRRLIPNWLTYPAVATGLILGAVTGGFSGGAMSLAGLGLGAVLYALPVAILGRGAGDLKLLAAVGSIGGPLFVLWCALFAEIAGGLVSVAVLIAKGQFGGTVVAAAVEVGSGRLPAARSQIGIPFAIPICAGALVVMVLN